MHKVKLAAAAASAIFALGVADIAAAGSVSHQGAYLQPAVERSAAGPSQPLLQQVQTRRSTRCRQVRRKHKRNGTIIGAIAGGVLGSQVAGRGARTEGTLIGAGVGAVAGNQIGKSNARRRC